MTPPIFLLFLVLQPQNWGENQIKAGGSSFFLVDSEREKRMVGEIGFHRALSPRLLIARACVC
jgi:hypothetical protein